MMAIIASSVEICLRARSIIWGHRDVRRMARLKPGAFWFVLFVSLIGCSRSAPPPANDDDATGNRPQIRVDDLKDSGDYTRRAGINLQEGQWDKVIADSSEAIRLNPNDTLARKFRALAYGGKHDWDNALAECSEAIRIDPKDAVAYEQRGVINVRMGNWDNAIADCTESLRLNPGNPIAFRYRGLAYGKKGKWDSAIADYTRIIQIDSRDAHAYRNRGWLYQAKGDMEKSRKDLDQAAMLDAQPRQ